MDTTAPGPQRPRRWPAAADLEWVPSGQPEGPGWRVVRGPSAGYVYRTDRRTEPTRRWLYYLIAGLASLAVTVLGVGWTGYWAVRGLVTDTGNDAFDDLLGAALGVPVVLFAVGMWRDIWGR